MQTPVWGRAEAADPRFASGSQHHKAEPEGDAQGRGHLQPPGTLEG